jgi:hypothetical protein
MRRLKRRQITLHYEQPGQTVMCIGIVGLLHVAHAPTMKRDHMVYINFRARRIHTVGTFLHLKMPLASRSSTHPQRDKNIHFYYSAAGMHPLHT